MVKYLTLYYIDDIMQCQIVDKLISSLGCTQARASRGSAKLGELYHADRHCRTLGPPRLRLCQGNKRADFLLHRARVCQWPFHWKYGKRSND